MEKILIMMVGLPRSGKSTQAMEIMEGALDYNRPNYTGRFTTIVCPDDIRLAMYGPTPFIASLEPLVWATAKIMVNALFEKFDTVILDATNTTRRGRDEWISDKWERQFICFNTSRYECKNRAIDKGQNYLLDVIDRMFIGLDPITKEECHYRDFKDPFLWPSIELLREREVFLEQMSKGKTNG